MIKIVGIGPGNPEYITEKAKKTIEKANYLVGTQRHLQAVQLQMGQRATQKAYTHLVSLKQHIEEGILNDQTVVLLASGDPLCYGITDWVKREFAQTPIEVITGVSSIQYFFQRIQKPMHDLFIASVHGREPQWDQWVNYPHLVLLTDGKWTPPRIAKEWVKRGKRGSLTVGERLSYEDEKISEFRLDAVEERNYEMNVVRIDVKRQ